ncbi:MAG: SBBP repeat-containing protein, partial [candidate division KSB1 bacterium]
MKTLITIFLFAAQLGFAFSFQSRTLSQEKNMGLFPESASFLDETEKLDCVCKETFGNGVQRAWLKNFASRKIQSDDDANAVTRDDSGNVYVAGRMRGANGHFDYAIVKYNDAGLEQWAAHYNGPSDGDDQANAIAVDKRGNVYVVGTSAGANGSYEYATIQYNAAGVEQWVARYPGQGGSNFYVGMNDIAITPAGHIIVTGFRGTIKYDKLGQEKWSNHVAGKRLAVDRANNVYVLETGVTKYTPFGKILWNTSYTGQSQAFVLDDSGSVYITGYHKFNTNPRVSDDVDYHTVKYDASGKQKWSMRYDGPCFVDADFPYDIRLDKAGSVYVTGSGGTLKYSVNGEQLWFMNQSGSALALDMGGNIYLMRSGREGGVTKYDHAGQQLWRDDSPTDQFLDLFVDKVGTVYVAGTGPISGGDPDFITIKYNSSGARKWVARYNGPNRFSSATGVAFAADKTGNVYVTGYSRNSDPRTDIVTFKYDAAGTRQWLVRYHRSESSYENPVAIALDDSNNVYIAGQSNPGDGSPASAVIIKYDIHGRKKWTADFLTPNTQGDVLTGMVVDKSGQVYIAGYTMLVSNTNFDYFTAKYDAAGKQKWVARYDAAGKEDFANA